MLIDASLVRWQITCSPLSTSTLWSVLMSAAVTTPGPDLARVSVALSPVPMRMATSLRFSSTSSTSSCRPSIVLYSCSTPSISTSVMAKPGIDDSSTRRRALPSVWPYPRSSGSITTLARLPVMRSIWGPRGRRTWLAVTVMFGVSWCLPAFAGGPGELLRVQLDDQRFVDVGGQVAAVGDRLEQAAELLRVDFDPGRRQVHRRGHRQGLLDAHLLLGLLRQGDRVAGLDLVGRQVHGLAVDRHAAVRDQLAGRRAGDREAHAVDDVVEARLQELQQVLTRVALLGRSLLVVVAELALQQAVDTLDLLLLAKLEGVVGQLAATRAGAGTVLAGLLLQL